MNSDKNKISKHAGEKLRKHRESIGRSIEIISLDTEIPACVIQDIEDGKDMEHEYYMELLFYYALPSEFLFD